LAQGDDGRLSQVVIQKAIYCAKTTINTAKLQQEQANLVNCAPQ
jgi:hypothetical protein